MLGGGTFTVGCAKDVLGLVAIIFDRSGRVDVGMGGGFALGKVPLPRNPFLGLEGIGGFPGSDRGMTGGTVIGASRLDGCCGGSSSSGC